MLVMTLPGWWPSGSKQTAILAPQQTGARVPDPGYLALRAHRPVGSKHGDGHQETKRLPKARTRHKPKLPPQSQVLQQDLQQGCVEGRSVASDR